MAFNASNSNTARVMTVTARDDANVASETVHVTDNDTPTLQVSQRGPMRLTEGGSGTYTVALGQPPSGDVLVEVNSPDMGAVTVNGSSGGFVDLTFTTGNWNTAQTVTVTIEDDEMSGVRVSPLRLTVREDPTAGGGTNRHVGTYTLELTSGISGDDATEAVGLLVTSPDRDAVQVRTGWNPFASNPNEWRVLFQPSNWNVPRTVTVLAQSDPDGRDEVVTVNNRYYAFDGDVRDQDYNQRGGLGPVADVTLAPAALVQHALDGARVGIEVTNTTWASGVATTAAVGDYFALDTAVPGLRLDRIYSVPSTRTVQLALAYDGSDFDTAQTLTVRVLAAAHTGSDVLPTGTRGEEASVAAVTVVEEGAGATYTRCG